MSWRKLLEKLRGLGPHKEYGEIVLAPGEGTLLVRLGYRPKHVHIDFLDSPPPVPGCGCQEDEVEFRFTMPDGFFIFYRVERAVRTAGWCAIRGGRYSD